MRLGRPERLSALLLGTTLLGAVFLGPSDLSGQAEDIRREILASQRRLEEVRAERALLRGEMSNLEGRVRNVSGELVNIERQISASRSALGEVDFQVDAVAEEIEGSSRNLVVTRERLRSGAAVLNRRLRDIYKRGPLHSLSVMLGAGSFPDLLTRYRYLRLIASYDRTLLARVGELEAQLVVQNDDLENHMSDLGRLRQAKQGEVASLRSVEDQHRRALESFRAEERRAGGRLEELDSDETRLTRLVTDLETRRVEAESRLSGGAPITMSSEDVGSLSWPVDGELIYRFGREQRPNGIVLRWNGIGIRASIGSPVRAVRAGTVVLAGPFEGYGPTVVLSHGEGFYTLYLYLEEIGVIQGRRVDIGQVVGTVGGADTPEGPHVEFQIRAPVDGGSPQARDPLQWLRPQGR
jgi:septal ring factor EnvC (AmiA/AmiB activator)